MENNLLQNNYQLIEYSLNISIFLKYIVLKKTYLNLVYLYSCS